MSALRWTHVSLLLMLLRVTAKPKENPPYMVREGDDVTLHCDVMWHQMACGHVTWTFSGSSEISTLVIRDGQPVSPGDRVGLIEDCSLLIRNVTVEDGGVYTCMQFKISRPHEVGLSVTTITEQKSGAFARLSCSVSQLGRCDHTVKWLFMGRYVEEDVAVSQPRCSEAVTFLDDYLKQVDGGAFKCEVTHRHTGAVQRFDFRPQASDEAATTTRSTAETTTTTTTTTTQARAGCSAVNYVMLVMRVAELVLVTVVIVLLIRARGKQRAADDLTELHGADRHGGTVKYENIGQQPASVKLHNLHTDINSPQK